MEKGFDEQTRELDEPMHYLAGRYHQEAMPPCMYCKHLTEIGNLGPSFTGWTCKAYPRGIASLFLSGELSHEHHQPNDNDFLFASKIYEDELGKYIIAWDGGFEEVEV
jgi:hypothetical protein